MKCGGNGRAREFFAQYGGVGKYKDAKAKYTSREGGLYLERLARAVQEDERRWARDRSDLYASHEIRAKRVASGKHERS